jgi:HEAT repeat protein
LQAQDPRDAAEARAELKRRGFADREVALARQLSDPDPHVRRRLVRLLPEIAGLDAVPWLVELSRDADADVRWTALTLLATTQDPALLRRVGELVRGDPDPRIQRLAERLGQTPR